MKPEAGRSWMVRGTLVMLALSCVMTVSRAQSQAKMVAHEEKSFQVSGTPHLQVSTFDGTVRVESWSKAEVLCQAEKRGRSQSDLERIEIIATQTGDELHFEARLTSRLNWNGQARADLTIFVPREVKLAARTGDGRIEARGLSGEINLHTGDGNINASNLNGVLIVQTGDGSVDLTDVSGKLQAQTGDGRVRLRGRFTDLEARTGDGSMEIVVEPGSQMNSAWSLRTGDGAIQLSLPDDFSAELDVHTNDGSISTELPITISGKLGNTLRGQLRQGGRLLTVRTGDGSITLRRN